MGNAKRMNAELVVAEGGANLVGREARDGPGSTARVIVQFGQATGIVEGNVELAST